MLTISQEFHFSASQVLDGLPVGHPCSGMHSHHYVVTVEFHLPEEDLGEAGSTEDFRELRGFGEWVEIILDDRHLNDVDGLGDPSTERLAVWIYNIWKPIYPLLGAVRVSETAHIGAEHRPGGSPHRT
jgi:6-pyruvoyltetrahydropterin/6-carboxytetrahydropterin synthase